MTTSIACSGFCQISLANWVGSSATTQKLCGTFRTGVGWMDRHQSNSVLGKFSNILLPLPLMIITRYDIIINYTNNYNYYSIHMNYPNF